MTGRMTDKERKGDWQHEIEDKYAWMFGPHGFYAECNGGWKGILNDLFEKIDRHVQGEWRTGTDDEPGFRVTQVKEKWATLRVYCWGLDDQIEAWIDEAEEASGRTCELCGKPGKVFGRSWYMTRCDEHAPEEGR
jgi:hypothetical protein